MTDGEIAKLTIDGGLGYRGQQGLAIPRLTDSLNALAEYSGLLLFDVKGGRRRSCGGLRPDQGTACQAGLDEESMQPSWRGDDSAESYGPYGSNADMASTASPLPWVAWFKPIQVSAIYEWWTGDETSAMDLARRWGVRVYITNDLGAAQAHEHHAAASWVQRAAPGNRPGVLAAARGAIASTVDEPDRGPVASEEEELGIDLDR